MLRPDTSIERLQWVLRAVHAGLWEWDLASGRHLYTSEVADFLGRGRAAEPPSTTEFIAQIVHPDDRERVDAAYTRLATGREPSGSIDIEYRIIRPDGATLWISCIGYLMRDEASRPVRVLGIKRDISARKQAEEAHERSAARTAELSLANRELESFAYSVSHDLRAPVRAVDAFGQMLRDRYGERLDTEGRRYLDRIKEAASRMGELIDALLQLSRTTSGHLSLERVNMSALASDITVELARAEPDRNVEIAIAYDVTATGDPALLRIALENLIGNAWKFTSRRERPRIEFGTQQTDRGPSFFVRDNGAGFEMEHAARLFTPFHRLHSAEEFSGTGIGLATVQRIITRHGGRIWAESAPGEGATFYFTLGGDR